MDVLKAIEHTALKAETTPRQIDGLCEEALAHGFHGVCVNPVYIAHASRRLAGSTVRVVSVIGFPLGAGTEASDVSDCQRALAEGARELDWVIPIGLALAGETAEVVRRARAVRAVTRGAALKVIFECGHFTVEALSELAKAVMTAEPDFLKTATGFGPRGASVEDICVLRAAACVRSRMLSAC
jgi:deoxyribose-phosphate aldolase